MKSKIAKGILEAILIIIAIILTILIYYITADIQTKIPTKVEKTCNIETKQYKGRNIFIITTNEKQTNKKILYFHGGSYMAEATSNHWKFVEQLAKDTGATIILPDYPLTPKYTYKDVFNMVEPLYKEIIEQIGSENLIIMGDSAGGGLSLALEELLGEQDIPMPTKTILISPWLDVRLNNPEIGNIEKSDTILNKESLRLAGIAYASSEGMENYLVNPIDGDLSKLQNVTILIGTHDILNPDVKLLQQRAQQQQKELNTKQEENIQQIEVKEYEKAKHIWIIDQNSSQELVDQGYQDIIELINK